MTDQPADTPPLSRVLAIAWGRSEAATRGPRAALSVEAIVAAAIELADEEGLDALSMSNLAQRLGYSPMSLYRHVPSKEDLLTLVQDAAFGDPPDQPVGVQWRDGLATWTRDITAAYLARPWVLDVPISGPPAMPHQIAWLDRVLAVLASTPLTSSERLSVALLLSGYSRNQAQLARDLARGRQRSGRTDDQEYPEFQRVLMEVVTPERYPAVHALLIEDAPGGDPGTGDTAIGSDADSPDTLPGGGAGSEDGPDGLDDEFEFGLQRILDGIAAYVDERDG